MVNEICRIVTRPAPELAGRSVHNAASIDDVQNRARNFNEDGTCEVTIRHEIMGVVGARDVPRCNELDLIFTQGRPQESGKNPAISAFFDQDNDR